MDYLIQHMLQTSAARTPDKEALVHGTERLTYAAVMEKTTGLAHGLREAGLARGDRVGIYVEASVQQVLSIFAISKASGVFVPINATLFPEQVAHVANDCGMKALITTRKKLTSLAEVLSSITSIEFLVLTEEGEEPQGLPPRIYDFGAFCDLKPTSNSREE